MDQESNSCDINAKCSNSEGNYSCACKEGFSGDGFLCQGELEYIAV